MTDSRFYSLLGISSLVAIAGAVGCHLLMALDYAIPLTVGATIGLMLFSIAIYFIGKRTAVADNKFLFGNAFMGVTMLKLFVCGGAMVAYILLANPENKLFVVPFFLIYLVYTVLEVIVLVRLAAAK